VTGRQDDDPVTAVSPALSLRHAVRSVAAAYTILASQKERGGDLAQHSEQLLGAARDFLESAGLAHLLGPAPIAQTGGGRDGDRQGAGPQAELVAAYARAGMQWARVTSAAAALGQALVAAGEWDNAQRLAAALEGAGEEAEAAVLTSDLREGFTAKEREMLAKIGGRMRATEIARALEIARKAWQGFRKYAPEDGLRIMPGHLEEINRAVTQFSNMDRAGRLNRYWTSYYRPLAWTNRGGATSGEIDYHLDMLDDRLNSIKKEKSERNGYYD
jgi:hypothetical protein